jgi:hypothetical protein
MPFLHPPTFRKRLTKAAYPREPTTVLSDGKLILLGVLTLTARFNETLVKHHTPAGKPEDPLDASEYYANALKAAFGPSGSNLTKPSLDGIQALLMLGLYEWSQTRGLSAWVYVGIAIRLAQSKGLAYEDDQDDNRALKQNNNMQKGGFKSSTVAHEDAVEKEVRRRTFWSCFVMDRMLSAGKYRPNMISVDQLLVQLPRSDNDFMFGRQAQPQPGFLNSDWMEDKKQATNLSDDDALSTYIRLVEIFGRFSKYSYAGGRRTEKDPPWLQSTQFYQLSKELETFHEALPPNLTYTEANLSAHIETRVATVYVSIHTLYSLCMIMLHREYLPFIPLRCQEPEGPLDAPTFPKKKYHAGNFWRESAAKICQAARDIVDIARTCQDSNALPESPQMGFAVYQAAFVSLYILHFPQMDTENHLHEACDGPFDGDIRLGRYTAMTVKILKEMIPRSRMAKGYVKTLTKMNEYFRGIESEYRTRFGKSQRFVGGGLEQYKMLEKELKEFGALEDTDRSIPSDGSDVPEQGRSRASTNDIGGSNPPDQGQPEPMQGVEGATPRAFGGSWAAVNASSPPAEPEDRPKYQQNQQFPIAFQSPNENSNPPSLISPSNGESTPSLHSPYSQAQQYQSQNMSGYPIVPQRTQAIQLSNPQGWTISSDKSNEQWMADQEQISMSGGQFDNYIQDDSLPAQYYHGFEYPQNFFGIVNNIQYPLMSNYNT